MRPHSNDLYGAGFVEELIDEPVLDVDLAEYVRARSPTSFSKGGGVCQDSFEGLRSGLPPCLSSRNGRSFERPSAPSGRKDDAPGGPGLYQPGFSDVSKGVLAGAFRIDSRMPDARR